MKPCAICSAETEHNFGDDDPKTRYPVCQECHESGRHDRWQHQAILRLRMAQVIFPSEGNLANDFAKLQRWEKHDSRIKDGVCPNGCARLENNECPVCHFTYHVT